MYVCKHKQKNMGTFASVLERIEVFGKRLKAFRLFWVRMETFGRLGSLVSTIPYGMYGMYVCIIITKNKDLEGYAWSL